jgi:hypothetical protein
MGVSQGDAFLLSHQVLQCAPVFGGALGCQVSHRHLSIGNLLPKLLLSLEAWKFPIPGGLWRKSRGSPASAAHNVCSFVIGALNCSWAVCLFRRTAGVFSFPVHALRW